MTGKILELRDYQREAIDAVDSAWAAGVNRPAVVLPTGAGKTVVFAHLARMLHGQGRRVCVIVHTDELVEQAVAESRSVAPGVSVGVVKGQQCEIGAELVVATIQTLRASSGQKMQLMRARGEWVVIVDECHHAAAPSYRTAIEELGSYAVGFTATMARGDGAALGDIWEKVVYRRSILDMIRDGYLLPVRGKRIRIKDLDLSRVRQSAGDYQAGELEEALSASLAPGIVADHYRELAGERFGMVFAPTVASAYEFQDAFKSRGFAIETVHGGMPKTERRAVLRDLDRGNIQIVSNCMVLTEGFNCPRVSAAVIARPTRSAALYIQMVGRILRPYPGQTEALVIDVVGVAGRHKLASLVDLAGEDVARKKLDEVEDLAELLLDADGLEFVEDKAAVTPSVPTPYVEGSTEVVDIDLFSRSHHAWGRTVDGRWFLEVPGLVTFIAPDGGSGLYVVAQTDGRGRGVITHRACDLSSAMAWGEQDARELAGDGVSALLDRGARWRKANTPPTTRQMNKARSLGIEVPGFGMTKGELAIEISRIETSRVVDPIVRKWVRDDG